MADSYFTLNSCQPSAVSFQLDTQDRLMLAFLDGRLLPTSDARLPLNDAGFVMGATVTDLARTFRFRLFRWADHLGRFRHSCDAAHIAQPLSDEQLTNVAERLVEHNKALLP